MRKSAIIFLWIIAAFATAARAQEGNQVIRLNSGLDDIVPSGSKVEKLAGNLGFPEGPVWVPRGGYLLFSDVAANVIDKWNPDDGEVSVFLDRSGFTGTDSTGIGGVNSQGKITIGSNGVTVDPQGRIVFCAHGDRQIVRLEKDGQRTILAARYEGKRLNSPNDLVYRSDGALYFTDPPGGLRERDKDPKKELSFNGVFLLKDGKLQLLIKDLLFPNGLTFSPDGKIFYVNDSFNRIIMRYDVQSDDTVTNGQVFIDVSSAPTKEYLNGMKVDRKGNVYSVGPGGVWIISPNGKHLGTIVFPQQPSNLAFGDADGKTLYVTARSELYRIRLKIPGIRP